MREIGNLKESYTYTEEALKMYKSLLKHPYHIKIIKAINNISQVYFYFFFYYWR